MAIFWLAGILTLLFVYGFGILVGRQTDKFEEVPIAVFGTLIVFVIIGFIATVVVIPSFNEFYRIVPK